MTTHPCPQAERGLFICNWQEIYASRLIIDTHSDIFQINMLMQSTLNILTIVITLKITIFPSSVNQFYIFMGLSAKM